jgi:hypothetical protein
VSGNGDQERRQDQLWPFVLAAVLNKKVRGLFWSGALIRRSVMDDMRVAFQERVTVQLQAAVTMT